ncbi:hypothetical protein NX059_011930 [Plenodomus lindquistii]|nr:hypothetical protein NX059_011930 [Plenodomus lindquistii]
MSSQYSKPRRTSTALDPYATPAVYYGESHSRKHIRARTYSANLEHSGRNAPITEGFPQGRRISHGTSLDARHHDCHANTRQTRSLPSLAASSSRWSPP